uniref:Elongation factor EFG domain-containing protein n=1 Tax=Ditylenchus dipsaci TaxID=166011 RepID=A0A915E5C6_9BILA
MPNDRGSELEEAEDRSRKDQHYLSSEVTSLYLSVSNEKILSEPIEHVCFTEDLFGEEKQKHWCSLKLRLEPTKKITRFKGVTVSIDNSEDDSAPAIKPSWLKVINEGCQLALYNGPVLGFPVCNLTITLRSLSTSGNRVNLALLSAAASRCVKEALERSAVSLIEPIMSVEVTLVSNEQGQISSDAVLQELSQRRANIQKIEQDNYGHLFIIHASIPLSETPGISSSIRSVSSGMSSMHMKFADYQCVAEEEQQNILEKQQHEGL